MIRENFSEKEAFLIKEIKTLSADSLVSRDCVFIIYTTIATKAGSFKVKLGQHS